MSIYLYSFRDVFGKFFTNASDDDLHFIAQIIVNILYCIASYS